MQIGKVKNMSDDWVDMRYGMDEDGVGTGKEHVQLNERVAQMEALLEALALYYAALRTASDNSVVDVALAPRYNSGFNQIVFTIPRKLRDDKAVLRAYLHQFDVYFGSQYGVYPLEVLRRKVDGVNGWLYGPLLELVVGND